MKIRIGRTGKLSLKRRVWNFQVESLDNENASFAKAILDCYDRAEVSEASAGAATFYVWVGISLKGSTL